MAVWRKLFETDAEFAERLGLAPSYLGQLKRGLRPITEKTARKLEARMGKPAGSLDIDGHSAPNHVIAPNAEIAGSMGTWDAKSALTKDDVTVPVYSDQELAAGASAQASGDGSERLFVRLERSIFEERSIDPSAAVCAKVSGDSMEPVLPNGTTVGINTADTEVRDGEIFAVIHGGMLRIKLLYRAPPAGLRLRSHNNAEYPDETYNDPDAAEITVIGRVFWWSVFC